MIAPNRPPPEPSTPPSSDERNVLGEPLQMCGVDPITGFFRDGVCRTCAQDLGSHTVCVIMTATFLAFSKAQGNDLSTPHPEHHFPGLKPGDPWCLCAPRWQEAYDAHAAPQVVLQATHIQALQHVSLIALREHDYRD
ncbi:MAG: DUF2237 domain-containing protein [Algisphaera sp.]